MYSNGFGHDPEVPAGFQDADIEMRELEESARDRDDRPRLPLAGHDGNAFSILGRARRAAQKAGWLKDGRWVQFQAEATSGDYDHLLATTMKWFNTDEEDSEDEG